MTAPVSRPATLWAIGVGPGDPELLTLKAQRLLASVPVLVWPAPLEGDGLARGIVAAHIPPGRIEIPIRLGFRPERADTAAAYAAAAAAIAGHIAAGRDVAVLCEGDPLLFGSVIHLLACLDPAIPVEVVPGVSSVQAAAAHTRHPLASLDEALVLVPATRPEADLMLLLAAAERAVVLKVGRHLPKLARVLARLGRTEGARVVERVGLPGQRIMTLAQALAAEPGYFSLVLVPGPGPRESPP